MSGSCSICDQQTTGRAKVCNECGAARHLYSMFASGRSIAARAVAKAKKEGALDRPSGECADCDAPATEYDHRDYGQPLSLAAVCTGCNIRRGPAIPRSWSWAEFIAYFERKSRPDCATPSVMARLRAMYFTDDDHTSGQHPSSFHRAMHSITFASIAATAARDHSSSSSVGFMGRTVFFCPLAVIANRCEFFAGGCNAARIDQRRARGMRQMLRRIQGRRTEDLAGENDRAGAAAAPRMPEP